MSSSSGRRALVTGTAGFIGFHLTRRLLSEGWLVDGVDSLTPYYDVELKRRRLAQLGRSNAFVAHEVNICDTARLKDIVAHGRPDVIIHLAAQAGVRYSIENPTAYVESNLQGFYSVLEIVREVQPSHFLFASTSSVYGANVSRPSMEIDRADNPLTFYAATKKAGEDLAHSYAHLWGVPTTGFRFFTVYGPWGRPDMALFRFVEAALKERPIDVYGHGQMERDFTYIDDLIEGIVRLIPTLPATGIAACEVDSISPAAPYRVVNIAGGRPVGLMAFIDAVAASTGKELILNMLPMQKGDMQRTFASPELLKALTGFVPNIEVPVGVSHFVEWYRSYYGV
jgi:UDP-glucuronate 4-epimerase